MIRHRTLCEQILPIDFVEKAFSDRKRHNLKKG